MGKELDLDKDEQLRTLQSFPFPYTGAGKNRRCFQLGWLRKFEWIEYSKTGDAAFCNVCRQFSTQTKDPTFTTSGFTNWKIAMEAGKGFQRHERSEIHLNAAAAKVERKQRKETETSVSTLVNSTVLLKRRYYVKAIVKTIIFLVQHHLALRGNWDIEDNEEQSLFTSLFAFAKENDAELAACERYMPSYAKYTSPLIQNELISTIAELLRDSIIREVIDADVNFFTILFDGTKDKHGDEIVSLDARFVSKGKPQEVLLFFETTDDQDAETFTSLTLNSLSRYGLDVQRILSQCYDGAAVMNGYKSGVARRLQDELNKTIPYIHCFNHRLHLVIIHVIKQIQTVKEFFDQLQLVYTMLKKPKIKKIHEGKSMHRVIDTRWTGHKGAVHAMLQNYVDFVNTFEQAVKNTSNKIDGEDIAICTGILTVITRKAFVFTLMTVNEILEVLAPADVVFQKREIGYRRAMPVVESVKSSILEYRSDARYQQIERNANELLGKITSGSVTSSRPVRQNRGKSTLLKEYTVEQSIGERSSEAIELKSFFFV